MLRCKTFDVNECELIAEFVDAKATINRIGHAACVVSGSVYLFGGFRHPLDKTSISRVSSISRTDFGYRIGTAESVSPVDSVGATAVAVGKHKDRIAIFGGLDMGGNFNNSLWIYSPFARPDDPLLAEADAAEATEDGDSSPPTPRANARWTQVKLPDAEDMPVRAFHSCCAVGAGNDKLLIFCGKTSHVAEAAPAGEPGEAEGEGSANPPANSSGEGSRERLLDDLWTVNLEELLARLDAHDVFDPNDEEATAPEPFEDATVDGMRYRATSVSCRAIPVPGLMKQCRSHVMIMSPATTLQQARGEGQAGEDEERGEGGPHDMAEPTPQPFTLQLFGGANVHDRLLVSRLSFDEELNVTEVSNAVDDGAMVPTTSFSFGAEVLSSPVALGLFADSNETRPALRAFVGLDGDEEVADEALKAAGLASFSCVLERAKQRAARVKEWEVLLESLDITATAPPKAPPTAPPSNANSAISLPPPAGSEVASAGIEADVEEGASTGVRVGGDGASSEASHDGETNVDAAATATATAAATADPETMMDGQDVIEVVSHAAALTYSFPNGDRYVGQMRCRSAIPAECPPGDDDLMAHLDLEMHGSGCLEYTDGWVYEGCFFRDRCAGVGELRYGAGPDAVTISGTFSPDGAGITAGKFDSKAVSGTGTLVATGDSATRYVLDGSTCTLDFKTDDLARNVHRGDTYTGALVRGKREGFGKLTQMDGTILEGEWKDDVFTGQGKMELNTGITLTGTFLEGRGHGKVKEVSSEGTYEGMYARGRRNGHGVMKHADGSSYEGKWVNHVACGKGTRKPGQIDPSHHEYIGNFKDNQYHGYGEKRYADGSVYSGDFVDGLEHGNGILKEADGSIWYVDMAHGKITDKALKRGPSVQTPHASACQ